MAEPAIVDGDDKHEKARFAVFQVAAMLKRLEADYHAAWYSVPPYTALRCLAEPRYALHDVYHRPPAKIENALSFNGID
jgi:hypothetical protein